jgi:hypothetical protein
MLKHLEWKCGGMPGMRQSRSLAVVDVREPLARSVLSTGAYVGWQWIRMSRWVIQSNAGKLDVKLNG